MTKITGEFVPAGKWLVEYDWDDPVELELEFSPSGEFTGQENYKRSKRWVSSALDGQWDYNPSKKRLAINGKYVDGNERFSVTPYIQGRERDQFTARDHESKEFFLRRIG